MTHETCLEHSSIRGRFSISEMKRQCLATSGNSDFHYDICESTHEKKDLFLAF
jgi:hypothetical protein